MKADLVVTAYGRPANRALAEAIHQAKQANPLAPVTVIVPSNFAGLAARRMLGSGELGVRGVANVSFVTPFRLAELLAVGELADQRPLTNPVLGAAVRSTLADDPRHFRRVRDHQATEQALAAAVGELSNVSEPGLEAIEAGGGYAASIVALYRSITSRLVGFHDEAAVAKAASSHHNLATLLDSFGHIIWHLPGPLSRPLAAFINAVLQSATTTTILAATTADAASNAEVNRALDSVGIDVPQSLGCPETMPDLAVATADHIISVTDADEEVRAVLREVVQLVDQGVSLDRIGIFHPVPDPYVRILEQQFAAAQIPANGPSRRRLSDMIAGRVLLNALALPAERWRRDRVMALVSSGPLRHNGEAARPAVWEAVSRHAGVVGSLRDWRAKLEIERHRVSHTIETAEATGRHESLDRLLQQRQDVDDLASFIESIASSVGAVEEAAGWRDRADAARDLLQVLLGPAHTHGWWPEAEQSAFESVESALDRLALLDEIEANPTAAVFMRALSAELSIARGRNGRYGDGVVYGPLASAPGHDLEAVFILGCTEGVCPSPRREDVLLPDRARALTNGELSLRLGQIDEQHRLFLAALSAAPPGRRWLFLPRGDLRSSRRSRPSRWLLPTASKLAGTELYATDFEHESPQGVHEVPSHAQALVQASHFTSVDERDLAQVYAYVQAGGEAAAHPAANLVERGLASQMARDGSAFTAFDGNLAGVATAVAVDLPMSPSRLETWAACGFRYYLAYVLGLRDRDDPERTIELSALDRGSGMHTVLERFMKEAVAAGAPAPDEPWSPAHRQRAKEIAAEVFDEYERRGRTGRHIIWETQKSDLLALIDEFLSADDRHRAATGATPTSLELPFGFSPETAVEIGVDDDRRLKFRGIIDRVDTAPQGAMYVSDYKTGKGTNYRDLGRDDPTKHGTMLQLGLYAEAVRQRFDVGRIDTRYWMVNTEAAHARYGYQWTDEHRDRLVDVLSTIVDGIDDGVFVAVPGEWQSFRSTYENCAYCEFDPICPKGRAEQAADKSSAPELSVRIDLIPKPVGIEQAQ